ncbi:MAG: methyltransferase [Rhizobiaceae bacterium]
MDPSVTTDHFLDHGIVVQQFAGSGHRSGLDAIMLAATVPKEIDGRVADIGAGAGVVGMAIAHRCLDAKVDLFEIDAGLSTLSSQSIGLPHNHHLAGRVASHMGDVAVAADLLATAGQKPGSYACIVANPPYNDKSHRTSPDPRKSAAHMAQPATAQTWVKAAAQMAAHRGLLALILRPENLQQWMAAAQKSFGGVVILPLHSRANKPASRVLIGATKNSRAALKLLPPLVLHNADGSNTPEAEDILRGRGSINLFS